MYRLYVDEVGTDDLTHLDKDDHRYLSLTGVAMKVVVARDDLTPKFDWIKCKVFDHDPDDPLIFHRSDIVKRKKAYGRLNNPDNAALFDRAIFRSMSTTEFSVITAVVDKKGMVNQPNWQNQHPYHYLMEILVEKYVQFLERQGATGDIMPEGRKGKKDDRLQEAFERVLDRGTYYVKKDRMQARISSPHLKVRYKRDNVAGLQLADLLAHPSHMHLRDRKGHDVSLGSFAAQVREMLLDAKYDRSNTGVISGYGTKWFP